MRHSGLSTLICFTLATLLPTACANIDRESAPPDIPIVAKARGTLTHIEGDRFSDGEGRIWRHLGPINYTNRSGQPPERSASTESRAPNSLSELAEAIRPLRVEDGHLYTTDEPPVDVAERILAMSEPPPTAPSPGWGGRLGEPIERPQPSEGSIEPQTVLGTDTRYRIWDSTSYPARANGRWTGNGCSGTFIGSRTVLIAAHCLYMNGTWSSMGQFVPGQNTNQTGGPWEPWGRWNIWTIYIATDWISSFVNTGSHDWQYDYGVVDLTIAPGWTGSPGWYGTTTSTTGTFTERCYPSTTPWGANTLGHWGGSGTIGATTSYQHISYNLDSAQGCSGVCLGSSSNNCVGIASTESSGSNEWRKWDSTVFSFVQEFSAYF